MLNYSKIISLNPFEYESFTNSKGQKVVLCEHPVLGDEAEVLVMFPEYQKAFYSGFHDAGDMTADHNEYEPSLVDGRLYIGDSEG